MEDILLEILDGLREGELDAGDVERILARYNRLAHAPVRKYAKKHIVPYYLKIKENKPGQWESWQVSPDLEARLLALLRMKPRRTASGVATITLISKPWSCSGNCLYCPSDARMPKSYLSAEPACQRAERNFFDPYLQVVSRLRALVNMGHPSSKIEIIILGGSFCDYPRSYQLWFAEQVFAALNDEDREERARQRRRAYRDAGIANDTEALQAQSAGLQQQINCGACNYNRAVEKLYRQSASWQQVEAWQSTGAEQLQQQQRRNESAAHRVVGFVVETRPESVTVENLKLIRQLGATKVQIGIQSLNPQVLAANKRGSSGNEVQTAARAIDLLRLFGFKVHTHFMVNLYGSTPEADKAEYRRFMQDADFQPDEVKIYPCALVEGTGLMQKYLEGSWQPYPEEVLLDVLVSDVLATPEFTRISRMIRDISAGDIVAGNKKGNLRQMVEARAQKSGQPISEMRFREINSLDTAPEALQMKELRYSCRSSREVFLQWVDAENRIAGFLRLSLPCESCVQAQPDLPVSPGQAMIREVHVYGRMAELEQAGAAQLANAQHAGLGRALIARACEVAKREGYSQINVISAVGTRNYYRKLGFSDAGLYQRKSLED